MKKFIFLILLLISGFAFSQTQNAVAKDSNNEKILNDKPSIFPKGTEVFRKMISDNFRMRKINSHKNIFCEITFIVERDGTMSNIKAKGNDEDFNKEAIRAVSKIKDKWIPAEINGQKVRSRYRVPLNINFN